MPPIRGRKIDSASASSPGTRPNTIGVSERELAELLGKLDDHNAGHAGSVKRTFARWPFRQCSLQLVLDHPGGSRATLQVACRNLSRGGAGVLHGAFVHSGTPCRLEMPRLDGRHESIGGLIVRCTHMQGVMHELGVKFTEPVRLCEFVQLDPLMGWSNFERVDPARLAGSLLVVTDSELDERIIGHYLTDTMLKLRFVKSAPEAAASDRGSADVALIDLGIEGAKGLFATVREKGIAASMIAIGPDASAATRKLLQNVEADGLVFKPLSSDRLLSMLADCMLVGDAVQIDPALAGEGSGALIKGCVEQLHGCASEIREAIAGQDAMRCYASCQHVKAIAAPLGLRGIAKQADQAAANVAQTMSVAESGGRLQGLARACERVRVSGSASQ